MAGGPTLELIQLKAKCCDMPTVFSLSLNSCSKEYDDLITVCAFCYMLLCSLLSFCACCFVVSLFFGRIEKSWR